MNAKLRAERGGELESIDEDDGACRFASMLAGDDGSGKVVRVLIQQLLVFLPCVSASPAHCFCAGVLQEGSDSQLPVKAVE